MTNQVPPSLDRFGEELNRAAHRELSGSATGSRHVPRRGVLAGGTLGLAGVGTALALALGGGAAAAPAFAVTPQGNGSVLITINQQESVPQANQKLLADGDNEVVAFYFANGPATSSAPVTCTPGAGVTGPPVQATMGTDGTQVIAAQNTGAGTYHVGACVTGKPGSDLTVPGAPTRTAVVVTPPTGTAGAGNSGSGDSGAGDSGSGNSGSGNSGAGSTPTTTLLHATPLPAGADAGNTGGDAGSGS